MSAAASEDILDWLNSSIAERESSANALLPLGTCPDWGRCTRECKHSDDPTWQSQESKDAKLHGVLRRCAADRKLIELHGGRGHACPAYDYDGDLDEFARFYNHETCPVVRLLAEGYGWTGGNR